MDSSFDQSPALCEGVAALPPLPMKWCELDSCACSAISKIALGWIWVKSLGASLRFEI